MTIKIQHETTKPELSYSDLKDGTLYEYHSHPTNRKILCMRAGLWSVLLFYADCVRIGSMNGKSDVKCFTLASEGTFVRLSND
jgi:hypothetical protein